MQKLRGNDAGFRGKGSKCPGNGWKPTGNRADFAGRVWDFAGRVLIFMFDVRIIHKNEFMSAKVKPDIKNRFVIIMADGRGEALTGHLISDRF
jgi:hypothetical protein